MHKITILGLLGAAVLAGCGATSAPEANAITAKAAMKMWRADPENVSILDVRTAEEYIFVGHAPMARNIPYKFLVYGWDAPKNKPAMRANPDFAADVKKAYRPQDTLLVMCGSGKRSGEAAKVLREAGFNAINIEGGFDGQRGEDCADRGAGKVIRPGWKQYGLVWTYALDPESMYIKD